MLGQRSSSASAPLLNHRRNAFLVGFVGFMHAVEEKGDLSGDCDFLCALFNISA